MKKLKLISIIAAVVSFAHCCYTEEGCVTNVIVYSYNTHLAAPSGWSGCSFVTKIPGVEWCYPGCSQTTTCADGEYIKFSDSGGSPCGPVLVGYVTLQCYSGLDYTTNMIIPAGCLGAKFRWGLECQSACSNCVPFLCISNCVSCPD